MSDNSLDDAKRVDSIHDMNHTCFEERLMEWAEHAKPSCMPEKNDRNTAAECDREIQYAFSLC